MWLALAADTPADAAWRGDLEALIRQAAGMLDVEPGVLPQRPSLADAPTGPTADDVAAAADMSPEERMEMIRGMVEGLAARLEENPDDAQGWRRLARSYAVLGEAEKAAEDAPPGGGPRARRSGNPSRLRPCPRRRPRLQCTAARSRLGLRADPGARSRRRRRTLVRRPRGGATRRSSGRTRPLGAPSAPARHRERKNTRRSGPRSTVCSPERDTRFPGPSFSGSGRATPPRSPLDMRMRMSRNRIIQSAIRTP